MATLCHGKGVQTVMNVMCGMPVADAQPDKYLVLRNAKIDMYKGSMRLAVNQWGTVEAGQDTFKANVGDSFNALSGGHLLMQSLSYLDTLMYQNVPP